MNREIGQNKSPKPESIGDITNEYLNNKRSALRTTIIWGGIRALSTASAISIVATHGSVDTPVIGQGFSMTYDIFERVGYHISPDQLTSTMRKSLPFFALLNARSMIGYYFQRRNLDKLSKRIENAQNADK